jgi:hypothetical protein
MKSTITIIIDKPMDGGEKNISIECKNLTNTNLEILKEILSKLVSNTEKTTKYLP